MVPPNAAEVVALSKVSALTMPAAEMYRAFSGHEPSVEAVARAVANSPLVKTALNGGDPNGGRIAQAAGSALPGTAPLELDVAIEGVQVCRAGAAVPHDERALADAFAGPEVELEVGLPGEGASSEVYFSDLSHEYVRLNAEYTT